MKYHNNCRSETESERDLDGIDVVSFLFLFAGLVILIVVTFLYCFFLLTFCFSMAYQNQVSQSQYYDIIPGPILKLKQSLRIQWWTNEESKKCGVRYFNAKQFSSNFFVMKSLVEFNFNWVLAFRILGTVVVVNGRKHPLLGSKMPRATFCLITTLLTVFEHAFVADRWKEPWLDG